MNETWPSKSDILTMSHTCIVALCPKMKQAAAAAAAAEEDRIRQEAEVKQAEEDRLAEEQVLV